MNEIDQYLEKFKELEKEYSSLSDSYKKLYEEYKTLHGEYGYAVKNANLYRDLARENQNSIQLIDFKLLESYKVINAIRERLDGIGLVHIVDEIINGLEGKAH